MLTFRSEAESVSWLMTFNRIIAKLSQGVFEVPLAQLLETQQRDIPAHVDYIVEHLRYVCCFCSPHYSISKHSFMLSTHLLL